MGKKIKEKQSTTSQPLSPPEPFPEHDTPKQPLEKYLPHNKYILKQSKQYLKHKKTIL